jgi:hypothetical protein
MCQAESGESCLPPSIGRFPSLANEILLGPCILPHRKVFLHGFKGKESEAERDLPPASSAPLAAEDGPFANLADLRGAGFLGLLPQDLADEARWGGEGDKELPDFAVTLAFGDAPPPEAGEDHSLRMVRLMDEVLDALGWCRWSLH